MTRRPLLGLIWTLAVLGGAHAERREAEAVDLNHADAAQLRTLPGIGESEVRKILKARPFATTYDLVMRRIITSNVYRRLQNKVVVRPLSRK